MQPDLHALRAALSQQPGRLTQCLESALDAARSPANRHTYIASPEAALEQALARSGQGQVSAGPLAGLPVSVKDLFDVAGEVTQAGSVVLRDAPPAGQDAAAVARLKAAGALIAGRTNMTEFAFSGVGINPHHGTPANPCDPVVARIPGGSSSGAAVSVATGAAVAGLGSDTGGSLRIPAALCGLVGFKSTASEVPTEGALPLSTTLDTVGAITRSVRDAVVLHEVLANRAVVLSHLPLARRRLVVARDLMLDGLEPAVAHAFDRSLAQLSRAGARIEERPLPALLELAALNATGGFSAAEAYAWHRRLLQTQGQAYDPRVALRIRRGAEMGAADYIDLINARSTWIARMQAALADVDAVLSPTVPLVAPPMADLASDDAFFRTNGLLLRNTSAVNMLDGCALSLPCHEAGSLPVGLMVLPGARLDDTVLDVALQIEAALSAA